MTCASCGVETSGDAAFCMGCGKPLAARAVPETPKQAGKGLWIGLAVAVCALPVVVLLGVGAYGAWSFSNEVHTTLSYDTHTSSIGDLVETQRVLEKRLKVAGIRGTVRSDGPYMRVVIPSSGADAAAVDVLMRTPGKLEFVPTAETTFADAPDLLAAIRETGQPVARADSNSIPVDAGHRADVQKALPADAVIWERKADGAATAWLADRAHAIHPAIDSARAMADDFGGWEVEVRFDSAGGAAFGAMTRSHVGKVLLIVIDGVVKTAPVIQGVIDGGTVRITMGHGRSQKEMADEARQLAIVLSVDALPLELTRADSP